MTASSAPDPEPESQPSKEQLTRRPTHPALPSADELRDVLTKNNAAPEQIDSLVWLLTTARNMGLTTFDAIGTMIKRDGSVISRVMRGNYPADLGALTTHIARYRSTINEQNKLGAAPFIAELSIVRERIVPICEMARITQQIGLIWGHNQTGKSAAFEHYHGLPDRDTILWRIPAGGALNASIDILAEACGVSTRKSSGEKRQKIIKRITPRTLLIVDEFHQAFIGRTLKMELIERIREIYDTCKCGVILCGTRIFVDMLTSDKFKEFLGQIGNRGVLRMFIPTAPSDRDCQLLYAGYGLAEPTGRAAQIAREISRRDGIGKLTKYFQIARMLAQNDSQPLSWPYFVRTHDTLSLWADEKGQQR